MSDLPSPADFQQPLTRERQVRFLEALSLSGNVRQACRSLGVSPMTAYRWRRGCAQFATGWEAALVVARAASEEVLADRALNGVEEAVLYHGEEVARRTRYDSRLLLAHLARLDAKAQDRNLAQAAQDFDAVLAHFGATGEMPEGLGESADPSNADPSDTDPDGSPKDDGIPLVERALRFLETQGCELGDDEDSETYPLDA